MRFNYLADTLSPYLFAEKYHPYHIPTKKLSPAGDTYNLERADTNKYLMYDFYMLDYLNNILDKPSTGFRDLNPDIEDSIRDGVQKLFPYLREELLDAVFYSVCAEMRNSTQISTTSNLLRLPKGSEERKLYADWLKYMKVHRGDYTNDDLETLGVDKPSSKRRSPRLEKGNSKDRNLSYKAANYAIKENGATRKDFMEMSAEVFQNGVWSPSFGGDAWANIAEAWILLNNSDKINPSTKQQAPVNLDKAYDKNYKETPGEQKAKAQERSQALNMAVKPMSVAIDHIYDLQHNTDTVFNKLKSYYNTGSGYVWIKQALDDKANVKNYHDLLKNTSGTVKAMALPTLYNKLGSTWESHARTNSPDSLYDRKAEEKKAAEAAEQQKIYTAKKDNLLSKLKSKFTDDVDDDDDFQDPKVADKNNVNPGDIVICVVPSNTNSLKITIDKEYVVTNVYSATLEIIDDGGHTTNVYFDRFHITGKSVNLNDQNKLYTVTDMVNWPKIDKLSINHGDKIACINNHGVEKVLTLGKVYTVTGYLEPVIEFKDDSGQIHAYSPLRFRLQENPKNQFNIGDTVENLYNGLIGTVVAKGIGTYKNDVEVQLSNGTKGYWGVETVKAVEEDRYSYNFKIGDKVKQKTGSGEPAIAIGMFKHGSGEDGVKVKLIADGLTGYWKAKNVTKIGAIHPTEDNSKVGDMVLCIDATANIGLTVGQKYAILGIDDDFITVKTDQGDDAEYVNTRFDIIPQRHKKEKSIVPTKQNTKVGDMIECINNRNQVNSLTVGKKYELVAFDSDYLIVKDNFGKHNYPYQPHRFKVIPQEPKEPKEPELDIDLSEYKVGDRVIYNEPHKPYTGVVKSIKHSEHGNLLLIHFKELNDDIEIQEIDPKLKKAPRSFAQKFNEEKLKIGDEVNVKSTIYNKVYSGTLKSIDDAHKEGLVYFPAQHGNSDHSEWFPMDKITKDIKI